MKSFFIIISREFFTDNSFNPFFSGVFLFRITFKMNLTNEWSSFFLLYSKFYRIELDYFILNCTIQCHFVLLIRRAKKRKEKKTKWYGHETALNICWQNRTKTVGIIFVHIVGVSPVIFHFIERNNRLHWKYL